MRRLNDVRERVALRHDGKLQWLPLLTDYTTRQNDLAFGVNRLFYIYAAVTM